jgi:ribosome-associated translation inhibitor RaiA
MTAGVRGREEEVPESFEIDVTTRDVSPDAEEYARAKISKLARHIRRPVLHARVRVTAHRDPAVEEPVTAQANLDIDGRLVRVQVHGASAHEAIDQLEARLRRRLERLAKLHEFHAAWKHDSGPAQRRRFFSRPADERRIVRRKSFAMKPCTVDEAITEMELLDYDFHLFTESGTNSACVLYRGGPSGYRLALVSPALIGELSPFEGPVVISPQPAPCLTEAGAAERLRLLDMPFLFYIDAAQGRASVLYNRYDGHYGLITPN